MDFSREAAELRAVMLVQARNSVVLADHMKFNRMATHRVRNFEQAAYLITDRMPDAKTARTFRSLIRIHSHALGRNALWCESFL